MPSNPIRKRESDKWGNKQGCIHVMIENHRRYEGYLSGKENSALNGIGTHELQDCASYM